MLNKYLKKYTHISSLKTGLLLLLSLFILGMTMNYGGVIKDIRGSYWDGPGDQVLQGWSFAQSNNSPTLGKTENSNYPFGEDLWNPIAVTNRAWYPIYWTYGKLMNSPIAAFNLIVFTGLAFSMLVSFFFTRRFITKNSALGAFIAMLTTFNPYLVNKSSGHLTYMFAVGLCLFGSWITLNIINDPTNWKRNCTLLGILVGCSFYFDVYLLLLIPSVTGFILFAKGMISVLNRSDIETVLFSTINYLRKIIRPLGSAIIVAIACMTPGISYIYNQRSAVSGFIASTRPNIRSEATSFSARPMDYLLPSSDNPVYPGPLRALRAAYQHGSNKGENVNFLGYTLITLWVIAAGVIVYNFKFSELLNMAKNESVIALYLIFILCFIFGLLFSLPPAYRPFGISLLPTPTTFITIVGGVWRVFARFQVIVQPAFIFSIVLATKFILKQQLINIPYKLKKINISVVILLLSSIIIIESTARVPFGTTTFTPRFNLLTPSKPTANDVLAAYPARGYLPTVLSSNQLTHEKLFFPVSPSTKEWELKDSLSDLNNPQTIPALRSMGVTSVLVLWPDQGKETIPGLIEVSSKDFDLDTQFTVTPKENNDIPGKESHRTASYYQLDRNTPTARYIAVVANLSRSLGSTKQTTDFFNRIDEDGLELGVIDLCDYEPVRRIGILDCTKPNVPLTLSFSSTIRLEKKINEKTKVIAGQIFSTSNTSSNIETTSISSNVKNIVNMSNVEPSSIIYISTTSPGIAVVEDAHLVSN
jgi:hypothetical protein